MNFTDIGLATMRKHYIMGANRSNNGAVNTTGVFMTDRTMMYVDGNVVRIGEACGAKLEVMDQGYQFYVLKGCNTGL